MMIDLHCHILPNIDDGARDLGMSVDMARAFADDGVEVVTCTPHILPGVYHNTGPFIREQVAALQRVIDNAGIPVTLMTGADNHVIPDFVAQIHNGHLLTLGDTRYVLVEPPHHVAPPRLREFCFEIQLAGFVPVLTHPERLAWIESHYAQMHDLVAGGTWIQLTCGSLRGTFGRQPRYWAEKMLAEGIVHILATDAHDLHKRPPDLGKGRRRAAELLGEAEAENLVSVRPRGVVANVDPSELPRPVGSVDGIRGGRNGDARANRVGGTRRGETAQRRSRGLFGLFSGGVRRHD